MPRTEDRWTYVLVTPDGLVAESIPWLVDKIRSARLEPVAARLVHLTSDRMLRIYDTPNRTRPVALPPRRAFDLWYGLGPGCVMALHRDEGDACAALLTVKGATDPSAARPDSIRYAGENALTNLVHCPDDAASAAAELVLLLGDSVAAHMRRLARSPVETVRTLTVGSIEDALPTCSGATALSVPVIVNRIRLRVVHHLAVSGSSDEALLSVLTKVRAALSYERDEILRMTTSTGRMSVARAHNERLHDDLVDVAQRSGDQAVATALLGLSAVLAGTATDWQDTSAALRSSEIVLSELERSMIELSTYV